MRVAVILILIQSLLFCKGLDLHQILTLKTVKNIALSYPNKTGKSFEKTAMAICMAETGCGKSRLGDTKLLRYGIKKASYGIMQVRLETARFVGKVYKLYDVKLYSDTQLIERLINDIGFNAKIAILYLNYLSEHSKSYFEMVSRYNGGRVNHPYFNKIQKYKKFLANFRL